ncbi:TetR/AcrR family transcriptional regulator [Natronohydrobacter thiooxidans]|uniref:TetR/AcrR family transcriptional regulator n=1 Tax=Natronohydrobacter thiooxidans TaxID=87172 RepID=UPI0008FF6D5F|nr:TetR/AcrR family transcriptional regulator [Natronohydrobacter thiooxidans]
MTISAMINRQGRKYDQVLDGARAVFVEMGYERASVDEIARVAGVSKATLYSYFPEKRLLFSEVYRTEILRLADSAVELTDSHLPPERALRDAGRRMLEYMISDFAQAMYRICVTETPRFPEIGRAFYENGPELGRERLGSYLRAACARGALQIEDIDLAADQFCQLVQTTICDRLLCGVQSEVTEAEISRTVEGAVTMFLARYGR